MTAAPTVSRRVDANVGVPEFGAMAAVNPAGTVVESVTGLLKTPTGSVWTTMLVDAPWAIEVVTEAGVIVNAAATTVIVTTAWRVIEWDASVAVIVRR